jgi:hypothetical protein
LFVDFFEEKLNKSLDQVNISRIFGIGILVSGRIPDIKKGRIIRPDILLARYPVHP